MQRGPIPVFFGHEDRLEAGTSVFVQSVIDTATVPLALVPITRKALPNVPQGSNEFTFRRFLVPWIMGFKGTALFVDGSDMLCLGDLSDLVCLADSKYAVQVVKRPDYETKHPRKFVGTAMEADNRDYSRKQWASVMLINCEHHQWLGVDIDYVRRASALELLQFRFIRDQYIGDLPATWNWLVDEDGPNPDAKLLHWTAGVPGLKRYIDAPSAGLWFNALLAGSKLSGG